MLRALGFVLKCGLFALAVLVLGNWVRWDGRTASERVTRWIHRPDFSEVAERVGSGLQRWSRSLTMDARAGADRASTRDRAGSSQAGPRREDRADPGSSESISPSERQKLRALIRELNSSHRRD
jgi:hypothetical protein